MTNTGASPLRINGSADDSGLGIGHSLVIRGLIGRILFNLSQVFGSSCCPQLNSVKVAPNLFVESFDGIS